MGSRIIGNSVTIACATTGYWCISRYDAAATCVIRHANIDGIAIGWCYAAASLIAFTNFRPTFISTIGVSCPILKKIV